MGGGAPNSVRPAGDQVEALEVALLVDQEVLLLGADGGGHPRGGRVAKRAQHAQRLVGHGPHRAQQRRLLVERLAVVGAERGRDAERDVAGRVLLEKGRRGAVPGRVAARLEGGAQAARTGSDDASGSPWISSLPENSMITPPSPVGEMNASCFSAVMPVIGWNQCVKCVAPFSIAQSFMALATTAAVSGLSGRPLSIVWRIAL